MKPQTLVLRLESNPISYVSTFGIKSALLGRSGSNIQAVMLVLLTALSLLFKPRVEAQWIQNPDNGHYYQVVAAGTPITWSLADSGASAAGGYLATITSAAENAFVYSLARANSNAWGPAALGQYGPWLGGFQPVGSPEPAGGWQWVNGEGALSYTSWNGPTEPNNYGSGEDRLHFHALWAPTGAWNDLRADGEGRVFGYVIEQGSAYDVQTNPCSLIETLKAEIDATDVDRNKRPLIASLDAACASFERENNAAGVNQLEAFQQKVRAQLAETNPAIAEEWIRAAQEIVDQITTPAARKPRGKIVYSVIGPSGYQIHILDTVTGQSTVLPGLLLQYISYPNWSPDGQWLTFGGGPSRLSEVYIVRPDGSQLTPLTSGGNNFVDPDWCPCGTKISFQRAEGYSWWINTDGSSQIQLPVRLSFLRWSPDGEALLGSNWGTGSYESDLFLYDLASATRTVITPHQPGRAYQRSDWSPDGQRLVVGRMDTATWKSDVVVMNRDGSGEVNLTQDTAGSSEGDPTWSPDGKWIFFMSDAAGNWDVWAMRTDGSSKMNLTQSPEMEIGPPDFFPQ